MKIENLPDEVWETVALTDSGTGTGAAPRPAARALQVCNFNGFVEESLPAYDQPCRTQVQRVSPAVGPHRKASASPSTRTSRSGAAPVGRDSPSKWKGPYSTPAAEWFAGGASVRAGPPAPVGSGRAWCDRSEWACGLLSPSTCPGGCTVSWRVLCPWVRCAGRARRPGGQVCRLRGPAGEAELGPDVREGQASTGPGLFHGPPRAPSVQPCVWGRGGPDDASSPAAGARRWGSGPASCDCGQGHPERPALLSSTRVLCPSEASPAPATSASLGFTRD